MKSKSINAIANNIDRLIVFDEEKSFLCKYEFPQIKFINTKKDFGIFIDQSFNLKEVIILVEINWGESPLEFYGYEVAKLLLDSPKRQSNFNLSFISILPRQVLYQLNIGKNRIFTQKFFHFLITPDFKLQDAKVPEISERKFKYLFNYCMSEIGILDKLFHDIAYLSESDKEKSLKFFNDINTYKDLLTDEIVLKSRDLFSLDERQIQQYKKEIRPQLELLLREKNNPGETLAKKSDSKVMIVEDNLVTLQKLEKQFSNFFHNVIGFQIGTIAYNELKKNALKYDVVITDMELLQGNLDDKIQGIDILELCEDQFPFLVTRVVSSLPKNALKKQIGKGLDEIIFKSASSESVIPPFENLVEFVQQIDKEVQKKKVLRYMPGPANAFWNDYTIQGNEGGKFKRFYYELTITNEDQFIKMWENVYTTAKKFLNAEHILIGTVFGKKEQAKEIIQKYDHNGKVDFLTQLLIHRLVIISRYKNGANFIYKNNSNKSESFYHLPNWREELPVNPKDYFGYLGFGASQLVPQAPGIDSSKITFTLIYNQLFEKEIEWLKGHSRLRTERIESFYLEHEDFCKEIIDGILWIISEDKKQQGATSQFKIVYPKQLENEIDMDENYVSKVLTALSSEDTVRKRHATRETVFCILRDFKHDDNDYEKLPQAIQMLIDKAIDSL